MSEGIPFSEEFADVDTGAKPGPLFTDLEPFLSGDCEPEKPSVTFVEGGGALFYSGRLNEIHGEPETGKTNVAIAACVQLLNDGGTVVYVDPEDTPAAVVNRLRSFGADPRAIREGFRYLHNPDEEDMERAIAHVESDPPALVVVDGLAELMAMTGASEDSNSEILQFYREFIRPFAEAGAAVLISDHVTKDAGSRGRWSRGGGAKLGRYDGCSYEIRLVQAYGPEHAGTVKLIVAKDRQGGVGPRGSCPARIEFAPVEHEDGSSGTHVAFVKPDAETFRPTALMEKICEHLEADPGAGTRDLYANAKGRKEYVLKAINELKAGGFIEIVPGGPGVKTQYVLRKKYPDADFESENE